MTDLPPREVDRLETAIRELTGALDRHRVEMAATYVRQDVLDPTLAAITTALAGVQEKVKGHSEAFTWIVRIVIAAVVLALLAMVLRQGGTP